MKRKQDVTWNPSRVMLFDGNNLAWKALYGGEALHDRKGNITSLLYRFLRTVHAVLARFERYVPIIVWDDGHSVLKKKMYPEYKMHRHKRVEASRAAGREEEAVDWHAEFDRQVTLLRTQGLPYLGIPQVSFRGVEADDIIYYLVQRYRKARNLVGICSSDKDMYQCVTRGVFLFDHTSKTVVNRKTFKHVTGMTKHQYILYRAMKGDPSDNIKGLRGVGEKTAVKAVSDVPFISTPRRFLAADLKNETAIKLQAKLVDDPAYFGSLNLSWKIMSLKFWYNRAYRTLLKKNNVGTPTKCVQAYLKRDLDAFNKWCMKYNMVNLMFGTSPMAMQQHNLKPYWMFFFRRGSVLHKVPKKERAA